MHKISNINTYKLILLRIQNFNTLVNYTVQCSYAF